MRQMPSQCVSFVVLIVGGVLKILISSSKSKISKLLQQLGPQNLLIGKAFAALFSPPIAFWCLRHLHLAHSLSAGSEGPPFPPIGHSKLSDTGDLRKDVGGTRYPAPIGRVCLFARLGVQIQSCTVFFPAGLKYMPFKKKNPHAVLAPVHKF